MAWGVAEAEGGWEAAMCEEGVTLLLNLLRLCPPKPSCSPQALLALDAEVPTLLAWF